MTAMTEARAAGTTQVSVPDIGDFKDVPIIEILVKEGDAINAEDPLLTLESDKATMEVPAPAGGTVEKILVKIGDKVNDPATLPRHPAGAGAAGPAGGGGEHQPAAAVPGGGLG
jgi:pyruvate/2-oxoglutarate dehydrogenase complex dihydrolipoamide acyltransferase (E2) component